MFTTILRTIHKCNLILTFKSEVTTVKMSLNNAVIYNNFIILLVLKLIDFKRLLQNINLKSNDYSKFVSYHDRFLSG